MKKFIASTVGNLGGYSLSRWITRDEIRILMYHRFSAEDDSRKLNQRIFELQVRFLKKNYNLVSLDEFIVNKEFYFNKNTKPHVIITTDDGYSDFFQYAYPVLKKYDAPATVFLTTDFINNKIWLWPDIIDYVLNTTREKSIKYYTGEIKFDFPLNTPQEKKIAWSNISNRCLFIDNVKKLELIENLYNILNVKLPENIPSKYEALNWDQIRDMSKNKIFFGSHTLSHPILTKISSALLHKEVNDSKKIIENELQREIYSFCYPNGKPSDYNHDIKSIVKKVGYRCAVTTNFGLNTCLSDDYELRRMPATKFYFKRDISGLSSLVLTIKKR